MRVWAEAAGQGGRAVADHQSALGEPQPRCPLGTTEAHVEGISPESTARTWEPQA